MELMLEKLLKDPPKVLQPTREEMMNMMNMKSWNEWTVKVNNENASKINIITIVLNGNEDHLAGKKLMDLVGTEMLELQEKLLESKPVSTLKKLRLQMIKPEGVWMNGSNNPVPPDENILNFLMGMGMI